MTDQEIDMMAALLRREAGFGPTARVEDLARIRELEAENARLRALAEKVINAHAQYAYAEPNFGVLLTLKDKARAALAGTRPGAYSASETEG